jgi:hypothetical protein
MLSGSNVAGSRGTGKVAGAGDLHSGVDAVSPPKRKIHYRSRARRMNAASRLGGNQRLKVDLIDDKSLDDLGLDNGGGDFHHRLVLEEQASFGNGPYVACEFQSFKKIKKIVRKHPTRAEVVDAGRVDLELFEKLQDILQACGDEVTPVWGIGPDKKTKRRRRHPLALEITLSHG